MIAAELSRLEKELGLQLPETDRRLMLEYPFPPDSDVAEYELCNDVNLLLDQNRNAAQVECGLRRPFAIGSDGAEEVYLIDLDASSSPVYVYELETGKTKVRAADLEQWKAQVAVFHQEIEEDATYMEQRKANNKWWQFWN